MTVIDRPISGKNVSSKIIMKTGSTFGDKMWVAVHMLSAVHIGYPETTNATEKKKSY